MVAAVYTNTRCMTRERAVGSGRLNHMSDGQNRVATDRSVCYYCHDIIAVDDITRQWKLDHYIITETPF